MFPNHRRVRSGVDRSGGLRVQLEEHVRAQPEEDHHRYHCRPLHLGILHSRPQCLQAGSLALTDTI